MPINSMSLSELPSILRGRLGLILGPGITCYPGIQADLVELLSPDFSGNFIEACDRAISNGASQYEVLEKVSTFFSTQKPSGLLTHLAKARWAAILSGSLDLAFEDKLQQEASKKPTRRPITVLDEFTQQPAPRTIPVYKLLGIASRRRFAASSVAYSQFRASWRHALPGFAERVQGSAVLCVGMSEFEWLLVDLVAEFSAGRSTAPSYLLFLSDDPLCSSENLERATTGRIKVAALSATVGDAVRGISQAITRGSTREFNFDGTQDNALQKLGKHEDLAAVVNCQLETSIDVEEKNRLADILFSPSVAQWDPFVHGLDFQRSITRELSDDLKRALEDARSQDSACILTGNAASGKTTILKRLAYDLAKNDVLTLWLRPCFYPDPARAIRGLFDDLAEYLSGKPVAIFLEDVVNSGTISPRMITSAARYAGVSIVLVVGARSSDWNSVDPADLLGPLSAITHHELPDTLDEEEWNSLPHYLLELGVHDSIAEAEQACRNAQTKYAQDTLGMLWYLLPETRASIASSIRDEFFRLGDVSQLRQVIVGATNHGTAILKRAYEMVAVSNRYGTSLPIEVLVSSLGVDYGEWLDACRTDGPAWGVLYADENEDSTVSYHTRNDLVTRTIIETINGGTLSHSGELRVLNDLFGGCEGRTSPVYREFLVRVLVPPMKKLDHLSFEDGLQLFDLAINGIPADDKTLIHQKGLWIKNKGKSPKQAKQVLLQALKAEVYPYTERGESDEHIHNSVAATVLDEIDQGEIPLPEGKDEIIKHLSKARSRTFFNARAAHVQGNLVLRLASKLDEAEKPDRIALINNALSELDRCLIVLRNTLRSRQSVLSDVNYLEGMREKLFISVVDLGDLREQAESLWRDFANQEGFILVLRKLFEDARCSNKGKDFRVAFEYGLDCRKQVAEAGVSVDPGISEVQLLILYQWRVVRAQLSKLEAEIDWVHIKNLVIEAMQHPPNSENFLFRFILALANAHLNEWPDANVIFHQLRQSAMPRDELWSTRGFLLDEKGGRKVCQGTIKVGASGKKFLHVEDFHTDLHVYSRHHWPNAGEIAHAHIQFSFAGATAVMPNL